jgi:hypothetical protein
VDQTLRRTMLKKMGLRSVILNIEQGLLDPP